MNQSVCIGGAQIYIGSKMSRRFVPKIMSLIRRCIELGDNLNFKRSRELYDAFDEGRCVYALDSSGKIVGFSYLSAWKQTHRPVVSRNSMIVHPDFRNCGIGKKMSWILFQLVAQKYPNHDLLSLTASPVIIHFNKEQRLKEISYQELWETYGINPVKDVEHRPNASYRFKPSSCSRKLFDNIEIIDETTGQLDKNMIFVMEAKQFPKHFSPNNFPQQELSTDREPLLVSGASPRAAPPQ